MINPFQKLMHPEKFVEKIEIKKVVASTKAYRKGVEKYKEQISAGKPVRPIVLLKHPEQDFYAVLDGHHRFYAFCELGFQNVDAAVIRSKTKFLFDRTKEGWLQPTPRMTKFIRIPAINLAKYVNNFIKNPRKNLQSTRGVIAKLKSRISSLRKKKP